MYRWWVEREAVLACERFGADIEKIKPVTSEGLSDTTAARQEASRSFVAIQKLNLCLGKLLNEMQSGLDELNPRLPKLCLFVNLSQRYRSVSGSNLVDSC